VLPWDEIKKKMNERDTFVKSLLNFQMAKVKPATIAQFKKDYV